MYILKTKWIFRRGPAERFEVDFAAKCHLHFNWIRARIGLHYYRANPGGEGVAHGPIRGFLTYKYNNIIIMVSGFSPPITWHPTSRATGLRAKSNLIRLTTIHMYVCVVHNPEEKPNFPSALHTMYTRRD